MTANRAHTNTCSVCGKPVDPESSPAMPFCSQRCQQVDLYGWFDERHGVPWESEEGTQADPADSGM